MGYASISYENGPEKFPNTSVFYEGRFIVQTGFCLGVILLLLFVRALFNLLSAEHPKAPRLWIGYVLLFAAYMLGGAFSKYYGKATVLFGFLNALLISFFYFAFRYGVKWEERQKEYLFRVLSVLGAVILAECLSMYFREGVVVNGVSNRGMLYMGWGSYNTVGCAMGMCAIAPLYFSVTKKHGWVFTALSVAYMLGLFLTQSRGSILFGTIAYVAALVYMIIKSPKKERIFSLIVIGVVVVAAAISMIFFADKLKTFFETLISAGTGDSGRKKLFKEAWNYFLSSPLFGVGWGGEWWADGVNLFKFFMAHNNALQLLGSLGIFGTLAYLFHRVQTGVLVFKRPSVEKSIGAFVILALLLMGMMDVHFFSCDLAAVLYPVILAFMEGSEFQKSSL